MTDRIICTLEKEQKEDNKVCLMIQNPPSLFISNVEVIIQQLFTQASFPSPLISEEQFRQYIEEIQKINSQLLNKQDYLGRTLLHHCILNEHFEFALILLNNPFVDLSLKTYQTKQTALMLACERGYSSIVVKILSESNVNDFDVNGKTLLMYACDNGGFFSIVQAILKYKPNVNFQDKEGRTCLMYALQKMSSFTLFHSNSLKLIVNAFLNEKLDFQLKDKTNRTVLDYAKLTKDEELYQGIKQRISM
ncbi:hypothetical protein ABK040_008261 [Willaertia magna]